MFEQPVATVYLQFLQKHAKTCKNMQKLQYPKFIRKRVPSGHCTWSFWWTCWEKKLLKPNNAPPDRGPGHGPCDFFSALGTTTGLHKFWIKVFGLEKKDYWLDINNYKQILKTCEDWEKLIFRKLWSKNPENPETWTPGLGNSATTAASSGISTGFSWTAGVSSWGLDLQKASKFYRNKW